MGMDDQTQLDKFIEAVSLTVVDVTEGWTSTDYFARGYKGQILQECRFMLDTLATGPVEGDEPEVRFARLLEHWIMHFSVEAYRQLAKSLSTGYSHVMGNVDAQIAAQAAFTISQELRVFDEYGLFEIRSQKYRVEG